MLRVIFPTQKNPVLIDNGWCPAALRQNKGRRKDILGGCVRFKVWFLFNSQHGSSDQSPQCTKMGIHFKFMVCNSLATSLSLTFQVYLCKYRLVCIYIYIWFIQDLATVDYYRDTVAHPNIRGLNNIKSKQPWKLSSIPRVTSSSLFGGCVCGKHTKNECKYINIYIYSLYTSYMYTHSVFISIPKSS